jgi:hypothetical protein
MNFEEALTLLKKGKKIRRSNFHRCVFFEVDGHGIVCVANLISARRKGTYTKRFDTAAFSIEDFEASDWEEYIADK